MSSTRRGSRLGLYTCIGLTIIVAVVVRPYALGIGPAADDYAQLGMLQGLYPVPRSALDLFDFADGSREELGALVRSGFFPWWSHAELRLSMWRPLSSALMWLDLRVLGQHYVLYHLHSFLWWIALVSAIATLWWRFLTPTVCALASLLFAVDEAHGVLIGWIANRNAIASTLFGVLALHAHVAGRENRLRHAGTLSGLSMLIGLLFGEYALTMVGYFVAYEWLARQESSRARAASLLPVILATSAFLAWRQLLHYGPLHSGIYVDPFAEPAAFLSAAAQRIPVFVGDLCLALRSDYWTFGLPWLDWLHNHGIVGSVWLTSLNPWRTTQVIVGAVALAVYSTLCRHVIQRSPAHHNIRWLTLGSVISLLPASSPFPSSRLLLAALIGFCPLLATFVLDSLSSPRRAVTATLAGLFAAFHCSVPIWHTYTETRMLYTAAHALRTVVGSMDVDDERLPRQRMIVMNAVDGSLGFYIPLIRMNLEMAAPERCWVLSGSPTPMTLQRTAINTFELSYVDGQSGTGSSYEQMFRSTHEPLRVGSVFDLDGLRVEVLAVRDGGFTHARFVLDRALEDPSIVFVHAGWSGLRRVTLPAVGQTMHIPSPVPAVLMRP